MRGSVERAFDALPPFVSVAKTAEFLGVSTRKVRVMCEKGWLEHFSLSHGRGKTYRINKDSIGKMACIESGKGPVADSADGEMDR